MAVNVSIKRNTPNAADLYNLYDYINGIISDNEAYYKSEDLKDEKFIKLKGVQDELKRETFDYSNRLKSTKRAV